MERWQPHPQWQQLSAIAPAARYLTPYEEAYRLLLEIEQSGQTPPYPRHSLEALPDAQIQAILPALRQYNIGNTDE